MNSSLVTADSTTHLRILLVSLMAGIVVVWIGISARVTTDTISFDIRFEAADLATAQNVPPGRP